MKDAEDAVFSQISELLTGPRGAEAMQTLQSLLDIYRKVPANQDAARNVGTATAGALTLPAYQTGTQSVVDQLSRQQ